MNMVDWDEIWKNESLPLWFFEKYIDKVDWQAISRNENLIKQLKIKELNSMLYVKA